MAKKINSIIAVFLVLTILFSSSVFAFAVASSYWKGNPVTAYSGQTTTVNVFRIQNMGSGDERVIAKIVQGEEIASLEKTDYIAPAGTKTNEVLVTIKIPFNTPIDKVYPVKLEFKTASLSGEAGGVVMGMGYEMGFDVLVTKKPKEELSPTEKTKLPWIIIALIIAIIIIVIIAFIIYKRRQARKIIRKKIKPGKFK